MTRTWPSDINGNDTELRIGPLRNLFLSGSSECLAATIFAVVSTLIGVVLCYIWLTDVKATGLWMAWTPVFAFSGLSWFLRWYYRRKRSWFAFCEQGCAYSATMTSDPVTIPWNEIKEIQLAEQAELKTEENTFFGVTTSTMMKEINRRYLRIASETCEIVFKLNGFPQSKQLLDMLLTHSNEREINLDHSRAETPELTAAKQAGQESSFGKTQITAVGVVMVIIFIILKVAINMNRNR